MAGGGGGIKRHSIDAQIEECRRVIDDLPVIEGKHQRKSKIEFRQDIMRSACKTLEWVQKNQSSLHAWVQAEKSKSIVDEIAASEVEATDAAQGS